MQALTLLLCCRLATSCLLIQSTTPVSQPTYAVPTMPWQLTAMHLDVAAWHPACGPRLYRMPPPTWPDPCLPACLPAPVPPFLSVLYEDYFKSLSHMER